MAEAVLDDDDRAALALVGDDGFGVVAVDKYRVFVVLQQVLIEERRACRLDRLISVADGHSDPAVGIVGIAPDLYRIGRREPEAALGVGRAVEARILVDRESLLRRGEKVEPLAVFAVGDIRTLGGPVVVGFVVKLCSAVLIGALEGVAQVDKAYAAVLKRLRNLVEIQVVVVPVVNKRKLVTDDIARRRHEHSRHRHAADLGFEVDKHFKVVVDLVLSGNGLVYQIAVAAVVNAACAVVALSQICVGVHANPEVPRGKMVGEICFKILAELTAQNGFGGRIGKLRQHALFGSAVALLGRDDKPERHQRNEAREKERRSVTCPCLRLGSCGSRHAVIFFARLFRRFGICFSECFRIAVPVSRPAVLSRKMPCTRVD